jgi:allophanate hydrolase
LAGLTIAELQDAYRTGRRLPEEVAAQVLAAIEASADPAIWITKIPADQFMARARALAADQEAHALPLYGIPFAIKDNFDFAGLPTTAACPAFSTMPAATAHAVQRLLDAGAMLVGKTNMDQFATGLVGTRSPYGAPRCVFDSAYISGGSSSGSAVAVAAGLCCFALGTDTAGSGRVPAGFNNIVGLKPTKGLVSTTGLVPACRSIDCASIFANTTQDALKILSVIQGDDVSDAFSRSSPAQNIPTTTFRFGVVAGAGRVFCGDTEAEAIYDSAIAHMQALGGTPVTIDYTPFREAAALLYGGPYVAERLAAIEEFYNAHAEEMDPVVRQVVAGAQNFTAADAWRGTYLLRALAREAAREFARMDVMLLPTSPTIYTVEAVMADPIRLNSTLGTYTNFVNLLDYAAIAVPAGFRGNGLPAGVTLIGPAFSDNALAHLAGRLHAATGAGAGLSRKPVFAPATEAPAQAHIKLAVAGAHLSGMPLNHQLLDLGATLFATTRTAAEYKLLALPGTVPPKPGLVRTPGFAGPGIEIEIWSLTESAFGRFVAALPQPMGIGRLRLADGTEMSGFTCEPCATEGATDITEYGGWRAYVARPAD